MWKLEHFNLHSKKTSEVFWYGRYNIDSTSYRRLWHLYIVHISMSDPRLELCLIDSFLSHWIDFYVVSTALNITVHLSWLHFPSISCKLNFQVEEGEGKVTSANIWAASNEIENLGGTPEIVSSVIVYWTIKILCHTEIDSSVLDKRLTFSSRACAFWSSSSVCKICKNHLIISSWFCESTNMCLTFQYCKVFSHCKMLIPSWVGASRYIWV